MNWLHRPQDAHKLIAALVAAIALVSIGSFFGYRAAGMPPTKTETFGLCFTLSQPDLLKYTPAYWDERNGLTDLSHETRASQRCMIGGRVVDLHQILVRREL